MGEGIGAEALEIRWPGKASEGVTFALRPICAEARVTGRC